MSIGYTELTESGIKQAIGLIVDLDERSGDALDETFAEMRATLDLVLSVADRTIAAGQVRLIYDPWTTFASSGTEFCSCAFRLPTSVIQSVDLVQLVETGTASASSSGIPLAGFPNFLDNAANSAAVEGILASGGGEDWFGTLAGLSAAVPAGILADFVIEVTLQPGMTIIDLATALAADGANRVFSDEATAAGIPMQAGHGGFVGVDMAGGVPALGKWGLAVMVVVMLSTALFILRRKQKNAPLMIT